jgi:hypothetical protein
MNTNLTDITVVLDRSGSMECVKEDTIGGFNTFLKEQQNGSPTMITLHQFDDQFETVIDGKDVHQAQPLTSSTFVPRGWTALLDAIGRAINHTGNRLEKASAGKVVFVIITDGEENRSKEFSRVKVFDMIKHQKEKYNWQFVFLGANQDAIKCAADIGIPKVTAMNYAANAVGTDKMFRAAASNIRAYSLSANTSKLCFSDEQRDEQKEAGATD